MRLQVEALRPSSRSLHEEIIDIGHFERSARRLARQVIPMCRQDVRLGPTCTVHFWLEVTRSVWCRFRVERVFLAERLLI